MLAYGLPRLVGRIIPRETAIAYPSVPAALARDHALFSERLRARLYPFRPHSKGFRLGALRTLAALLPCPAPRASREKSPEPTTPFSPAQSHLRKSGRVCGTTPPAGRLLCSAPFVGGRGGLRART